MSFTHISGLTLYEDIPAILIDSLQQKPSGYLECMQQLYNYVDSLPWSKFLKREVQHYGYVYDYNLREPQTKVLKKGKKPPKVLKKLAKVFYKTGMMRNKPNQIIVNKYLPGEGIGKHRDHHPIFDNDIATLSLGSEYVMTFRHHKSHDNYDKNTTVDLPLPVGSLLVFGDEARYSWSHEISSRKSDVINGKRIKRGTRISITFRTVKDEYK